MDPVLGRIVEEAQQPLGLAGDLGDRLGPLDAVVGHERLDRPLGMAAILGPDDLVQRPAGAGLHAGGQRAKNVPGQVKLEGNNVSFSVFGLAGVVCAACASRWKSLVNSPPGSRCCCRTSTSASSAWRWRSRRGC